MARRTWWVCAIRCLFWAGVGSLAFAGATLRAAPTALAHGIPSLPLTKALIRYANETGLQIVYVSGLVHDQRSTEVPAGLAPPAALGRLLEGTGLDFQFVNARLVHIIEAPARAQVPSTARAPSRAQAAVGRAAAPPAATEEVVISAQRSATPENRTPISIAVWNEESMEVAGVRSTADIAAYTPGVQFDHYPEFGSGYSTNIAIRGINSNSGSTVALYMDDTPLPATSQWAALPGAGFYGRAFPLTFDLERVEVLRGPQGTSFGSGAMGGAIRFISKQPNLESYEGLVHSELATTERGAPSYEAGAAAGGPIVPERLGFRVSAWYRQDGGYIDRVDPFTGATVEPNSNSSQSSVVRGALTLAPSEAVRITPSLTYQDVRVHDTSSFFLYLSDPAAGILRNGKLLQQPLEDDYYLASLKIGAALDRIDLTAVTSYFDRSMRALTDLTNRGYGFGSPLGPEYPTAYGDAIAMMTDLRERVVSQELRLSSAQFARPVRWTVGVFYSHGHNAGSENIVSGPIAPQQPADSFNGVEQSDSEVAGFGEAALLLGEHLTASAGVRVARFAYDALQSASGPANAGVPPDLRVSDVQRMVTPRLGLDYQVNGDTLVYGSVASGAEPGGFNVRGGCVGLYPDSYGPDEVWSYEVGAKSAALDNRAQLNLSVFHMGWRNKQQTQYAGPYLCTYTGNFGTAASDGFEASGQALIGGHLTANLAVAYADARYTQTVRSDNVLVVASGDAIGALPLVPAPWNLSGTLDYRFPVGTDTTANLYLADYFRSRNPGPFYTWNPESPVYSVNDLGRRPDPSVNVLNLRSALNWSHLDLALYLDNVLDTRPTLSLRNPCRMCELFYATTLRPRTLGLAGTWRF